MSTFVDRLVAKVPGSLTVKALGSATVITLLFGIPYFTGTADKRQGHQFFSSEKPEAIILQQEEARKRYLQRQKEEQAAITATAAAQEQQSK